MKQILRTVIFWVNAYPQIFSFWMVNPTKKKKKCNKNGLKSLQPPESICIKRLTCIFNVAFLYLKKNGQHTIFEVNYGEKKISLCKRLFFSFSFLGALGAVGFAWYVSKVLRGQLIYTKY